MVSGEGGNDDISYFERLALFKIGPRGLRRFFLDAHGRMAGGVNAHGMFSGELVYAFHVVRVFVGEQNGVQLIRLHAGRPHLIPQPGGAEPGIHQQDGFPRPDNGGISPAAAAQHAKLHHARNIIPPPEGSKTVSMLFFMTWEHEKILFSSTGLTFQVH